MYFSFLKVYYVYFIAGFSRKLKELDDEVYDEQKPKETRPAESVRTSI